jgi:hypothetical protein
MRPLDDTNPTDDPSGQETPGESQDTENQDEKATVSADDVEIAVRMGIKLLNEGNGLKVIQDAVNQSKDPGQVIGQFLAQLMAKMAEDLQAKIGLDPKVFLAKKGFLDTILDYIEHKLGLPSDFSDKVYNEVLQVIKAAASGPAPPNNVMGGQTLDSAPPGDPSMGGGAPPPQGPPQGGGLDQGQPQQPGGQY